MPDAINPPPQPPVQQPQIDWRKALLALIALAMCCTTALVIAGKVPASSLGTVGAILLALLVPSAVHPTDGTSPLQAILALLTQPQKPVAPPPPPVPKAADSTPTQP